MKTLNPIILALLLAIGGNAALAEESTSGGGVTAWKDRVQRDLARWNFSNDDAIVKAEREIQNKHSFVVRCDRGWLGLGGALSVENCAIGVTRIASALEQVKPNISKDLLSTIVVQLSRPGLWQGLTFQGREMKVPYNATPQLMAKFINSELGLVFATSLGDLYKVNERLADRIQKKYFVKVISPSDLDVYQTHDGLKKVEVAMFLVANGQPYSENEFKKLGFDTIVLGHKTASIYEDSGELRMTLDYTDHPGEMFMHLLEVAKATDRKWMKFVPLNRWTWNEILAFREDRQKVLQAAVALKTALGVDEVQCVLDSKESGAVSMRDCRIGLENVQRALGNQQTQPNLKAKGVNGVLIKNFTMANYEQDPATKRLLIDFKATPEKITEAFKDDRAPGT